MTTAAATTPRTLTAGHIEGDWYCLVLDGDERVYTQDRSIAAAAADAKRSGHAFHLDIETRDGRRVVVDLQTVIEQPTATHPQTPPATSAPKAPAPQATSTRALVQAPAIPTGLISDPAALSNQLTSLRQHYHVMSPAISVSQMAPGFGANLAVVQIDTTVTWNKEETSAIGPDTYWSKTIHGGDKSKRSLRKEGILKLGQAIGVQWVPEHCRRTDNRKEPYLWSWQYFGAVRTHDGQVMPLQGSYELDLRDGSAAAKAMTANQLPKARQNGNEVCETKAMLRALRTLGIQQAYTVDELKKPFLIVRFSFTPDMADPEIKKLVTQQAMSGIGALYATPTMGALPAPTLPALPAAADLDDVFTDATDSAPATQQKPAPSATAQPDTIPDGSTTIAEVKREKGVNAKTQRPWVRYDVTFATGEIASTFSHSVQQLVDDAERQKARVRITTTEQEGYNDKLDTLEIIDSRQQSLPAGGY